MKNIYLFIPLVLFTLFLGSCKEVKEDVNKAKDAIVKTVVDFPEWAEDATIYEVNVRQYTPEGTFNAFADHLPRLKELGVKILWFMPIHPISKEKRKGGLGSYYAVQDYKKVNPEMGDLQDFRNVVDKAHELGMKVILDWVPNHTGFDNEWINANPEWYEKDSLGEITHPKGTDWYDVASLDYSQGAMRAEMIESMDYWVEELNTDGFRCDVAHEVPDEFWNEVSLHFAQKEKSLFFLAESDHDSHRNKKYFHANYGWHLHHLMNELANGRIGTEEIAKYLMENEERYDRGVHLHFTSNHDENSWKGSAPERFGDLNPLMNVFAFTFQGMPLIYSGQESGLDRKLAFFEKDSIEWGDFKDQEFFKSLVQLKKDNPALYNRMENSNTVIITAENDVLHYRREYNDNFIDVILNVSDKANNYTLVSGLSGKEYFTGESVEFKSNEVVEMEPKSYKVVIKY